MNFNELEELKNEYLNDKSLSKYERTISTTVLDAAIQIGRANHTIQENIKKINNLRIEIIRKAEKYLNSNEVVYPDWSGGKTVEISDIMVDIISNAKNPIYLDEDGNVMRSDTIIAMATVDSDSVSGSIPICIDNELEKDINEVNNLGRNTNMVNETKWNNVEKDLVTIFPDLFVELSVNTDGSCNNIDEKEYNYKVLESRIHTLNIDPKISKILREIINHQKWTMFNPIPLEFIEYNLEKSENRTK